MAVPYKLNYFEIESGLGTTSTFLHKGNFTANKIIKIAGTSNDILLGDGSTTPLSGIITLASFSAVSPLLYNNTTGAFSMSQSSSGVSGYLSSTDWTTFNTKQNAITLTTIGSSGASTFIGSILNIPQYTDQYLGTVTSVAALTLGTTGTDLSSTVVNGTTTPVITLNVPTASATNRGALSPSDWSTFNAKQDAGNYITSLTGEATASGPGAASVTLSNTAVIGKVLTGLNVTGGAVASTDSILAAFGKVQNQINGLIGGSIFQGTWDALTNTPALASGVGTNGYYYIVSVDGSTNLDGITDWKVGDWAIFAGTAWEKVDNTDSVTSVNGYNGTVSLVTGDVLEGAGTLPSRPSQLYFTNARARTAISLTTIGSSGDSTYDSGTGILNIPNYGAVLSGYVTLGTVQTITGSKTFQATTYFNTIGVPAIVSVTDTNIAVDASSSTSIAVKATSNSGRAIVAESTSDIAAQLTSGTGVGLSVTSLSNTIANFYGASSVLKASISQDGNITGNSFIKSGGLATQFLKADGSVDSNTYLTSASLTGYVPYTGATTDVNLGLFDITATALIKAGGVDTQFLKADGSVDNNTYLTANDLPSTLSLYATNVPASVSGYFKLVTTIDDPDFNTTAVDIPTGAITTTNQLIASLVSPTNLINGNPGVFNVTTIGNIRKVSGSGQAEFYFEAYKRTSAGVETLVATSSPTLPVVNSTYAEFSATALWNDGTFDVTDTIVLKFYGVRIAGGSNPIYDFQFGGVSPVRTFVPIPTAVIPNIYLEQLADVEDGTASNNDGIFFDSSVSIWKYKSISEALGYTPVTDARTLTINSTTFDLTANRSWSVGTVTSVAALTLGTAGSDLSSSVANGTTTPVITLNVPTSSAVNRGVLSSTDWTTFNTKVGDVTATSPIFSSGGSTPNIAIQQSSGSQNGYLSSTDWTTFNNKQAAGNYITSLTGEATASGPGAAAVTLNNASVTAKLLTGVNITGGTVLSTDTMLTAFGKLQNQINGLLGSTIYQGTWNASTNSPSLSSGVGVRGYYYIVSVAGTTNLDGITDWFVGDWAIFDGTSWQQVDNTDAVVSVNGQTGAVSLTTDNIAEGATNKYYLDSRARASLSFAAGSGAYNSTTGLITIPTNTNQLTNGASFITLGSLSGSAPIQYNNGTGTIGITQSSAASNGFLSSTDWNTFNNKANSNGSNASGTWGINVTGNAATATNVAWSGVTSKPSAIMFYEGFTLNADTMSTNSTGFTYAVNAPYVGPITRISAGASYDLWINAAYTGGSGIAFRTRNGDTATFNPWRVILNDANYTSYSPSLTGSGASGTWGISITGSAGSASSASTAGTVTHNASRTDSAWYNAVWAAGTPSPMYSCDAVQIQSSTGSIRANIFYDNQDTNYYLNPNGTSQLLDSIFGDNSGSDQGIQIKYGNNVSGYGRIRFYQSSGNHSTIHSFSASWQSGSLQSASSGAINLAGQNGTTFGDWSNPSVWIDNTGVAQARDSFRAPIFYDSQDTGYYVDPNGTSNLNKLSGQTMSYNDMNSMSINSPYAARYSASSSYRNGTMGLAQIDFNIIGSNWGSGFIDSWSNPANAPGGSSHYVGIQAMHANLQDNTSFYGFQMVCAGEAINRFFLRSAWPTVRSWVEMIHSGNIGSQSVNYANSAGSISGFNNPTTAATANTIAYRTGDGDLSVRELIMTSSVQDIAPSSLIGIYPTTNQAVKISASGARGFLNVPTRTGGDASGTWGINVTGYANYLTSNNSSVSGGFVSWNGNADTTNNPNSNYWYGMRVSHGDALSYYSVTFAVDFFSNTFQYRRILNGGNQGWVTVIDSSNITSQSVSYASTAGSAPNAGNANPFYNVSAGDGNGIQFWSSEQYKISMGVGSLYQYGPVIDYSIKTQMDTGSTGRGFTWGRNGVTPIAALNSTSGNMQIAGDFTSTYSFASGSIRLGDMWGGAGLYRPSGSMVFGIQDSDWIFSKAAVTQAYFSGGDGNLWMRWAGAFISDLLAARGSLASANNWTGQNYFVSNKNTTSDSAPLQAYSNNGSGAIMSFHRSGAYAVNFGLDSDNVMRIGGWSASANRFQMDMSGNLTMAGDVTAYSDARVKENIVTVENALEKTLQLRGVYYNRTDSDDKKRKIGVIAQETLDVLPEVVGKDNNDMYNVAYGNMGGLFIEAIKELAADNKYLRAQIEELKKSIN